MPTLLGVHVDLVRGIVHDLCLYEFPWDHAGADQTCASAFASSLLLAHIH